MAAKKAAAKKPAAKKATTKSAAPKAAKAPAKAAAKAAPKAIKDALNRTQLVAYVAETAGAEPKVVKAVLAAVEAAIVGSVSKKGPGVFTLPGLMKVMAVKVPAKPKRTGKDPFTGEMRTFAAKPASVKVKVRALKKLKDAAL